MTAALTADLARVPLGFWPTPISDAPRLGEAIGRRLLVKRDDLTGLAMGGNKTRKLEYLIADALAAGADTLVAEGFGQSNNVVQSAAAAARYGLASVLVLDAEPSAVPRGNILLDGVLGAQVVYADGRPIDRVVVEEHDRIVAAGGRPYVLPPGGSTGIGVAGLVAAAEECAEQLADADRPDAIVLATGTGGTQAGLLLGTRALGWDVPVIGISTGKSVEEMVPAIVAMAHAAAVELGLDVKVGPADVVVHEQYIGRGYAQPGPEDFDAILLAARCDGLLLDPVYTGRALRGLIDLLGRGAVAGDGPLLFWHTGGLPALFAIDDPRARGPVTEEQT